MRPARLLAQAAQSTRQAFVDEFDEAHFLVIQLTDGTEELVDGLDAHPTDGGEPWSARSEDTRSGTVVGSLSLRDIHRRMAAVPEPMTAERLAAMLALPHYVLPSRKRAGATLGDSGQISLGRGVGNDIVLRHSSVSRHHAMLEYDELERFYICDAGSSNFTKVRGRMIEPTEIASFMPGEEIFLGDVSIRVVEAAMLWNAIDLARRS